jgi:hypothetical protein
MGLYYHKYEVRAANRSGRDLYNSVPWTLDLLNVTFKCSARNSVSAASVGNAAITYKSLVAPTWMPVAPVVVPRSGSGLLDKASRRAERDPDQKKQHCDKAAHGETPFG